MYKYFIVPAYIKAAFDGFQVGVNAVNFIPLINGYFAITERIKIDFPEQFATVAQALDAMGEVIELREIDRSEIDISDLGPAIV